MNKEKTTNNRECGQTYTKGRKTLRNIDELRYYIMAVIDEAVGEGNICGTLKIILHK